MASQRVNFFQRNSAGAPLIGATITTSSRYDDNTAGPVIGNAFQLSAANQPGFYYFDVDVADSKRLTVVTDAGGGVSGNNRYNAFVLDDIDPTARLIAKQTWDDLTAARNVAGSFGLALGTTIQTSIAAIPDASEIEDAVWDAGTIDHQSSGTFGLAVSGVPQASASAVWGADASIYGGGIGTIMGDLMVSGPADTWDVTLASHVSPGSTGAALNAISGSTPAAVASAVWGALVASNQVSGSFGQAVTIMQALMHRNWRLSGATYSGTPPRLTSANMVLYPSKADAIAQTNALLTLAFTATYNGSGEMTAAIQTDL